jgi:hypothetical protein
MKPKVMTQPPEDPIYTGPLLDRNEAADRLAVSPSTVWRHGRSSQLRARISS